MKKIIPKIPKADLYHGRSQEYDMCDECDCCEKKAVYDVEKTVRVRDHDTGEETDDCCDEEFKLCKDCFKKYNL